MDRGVVAGSGIVPVDEQSVLIQMQNVTIILASQIGKKETLVKVTAIRQHVGHLRQRIVFVESVNFQMSFRP